MLYLTFIGIETSLPYWSRKLHQNLRLKFRQLTTQASTITFQKLLTMACNNMIILQYKRATTTTYNDPLFYINITISE